MAPAQPRVNRSGMRGDRCALVGKLRQVQHRQPFPAALKQHPPLESTRAHNRKTGQDLFPLGPETGRHQRHLFQDVGKRTRFGDSLVQKDPVIKRLVPGTNERESGIGVEILACEIGQPQRQVGKLRKPLGFLGVCNKTSRIDENLALIEAGSRTSPNNSVAKDIRHSDVRT